MVDEERNESYLLWEEARGIVSFARAFFLTSRAILFNPFDFFSRHVSGGNKSLRYRIIRALCFALLLGYIKLALDVINLYWIKHLSANVVSGANQAQLALLANMTLDSPFLIFRPLIGFFVRIILLMAGVKLVFGFNKPIWPVIFVASYASAANLFYCIPFIGGFFAFSWFIMLTFVGVRTFYQGPPFKSMMAAFIVPLFVMLFVFVSLGPTVNRLILSFYPEAQLHVVRFNEATAYSYTSSVAHACNEYKKDLGFYPKQLSVLKNYINLSILNELESNVPSGGYLFEYRLLDEEHFAVLANPVKEGETGRFIFYADQTNRIRLNDAAGAEISDVTALETLQIQVNPTE